MEESYIDDEETEDLEDESAGPYKASYVLVAIDTHSSMFKADGAPSAFRNCVGAAYRLADALLLKSDKRGYSPFALVLNDKDEKASLVNFKDNMIETNKLLKGMASMSEEELKAQYMRDYDLDLAAFFQLCKKKFKDISTSFYKRILIFVTNDPDPVNGDRNKRFTALNEARNFQENDIVFQLVVPDEHFTYSVFYDELFSLLQQKRVEIICEDEEGLYEKLTSVIWFRHTQRKLLFYPFADDFTKYISVYKKSYIKYHRLLNNDVVAEDGTLVKKIRQAAEEGEEAPQTSEEFTVVDKDSNRTFGEVSFDLGEKLEAYRNDFPIGYTLLYVSSRLTPLGVVIAEPKIVEADQDEELPFFDHFWQHCVDNEKVLVCAKMMKIGDDPRAVEMIPKLIHGNKVFLVKQIPFADEMEEPEEDLTSEITPTQKQIDVTDELIQQLSLEFSSSYLVNVEHMKKEWYIKSKLLEEPRDEKEPQELFTPEDIDQKISGIVDRYLTMFPPEKASKRKRDNKSN